MITRFVTLALATLLAFVPLASAVLPDDCALRCDSNFDQQCGAAEAIAYGAHFGHTCTIDPSNSTTGCEHVSGNAYDAKITCAVCGDFDGSGTVGGGDNVVMGAEWAEKRCGIVRPATVASLTVSGDQAEAFEHMDVWADKDFGSDPICNQDNSDDQILFAKALCYAYLLNSSDSSQCDGDGYTKAQLRTQIVDELNLVATSTVSGAAGQHDDCNSGGGDVVGAARNTAAYVQAALLVNLPTVDATVNTAFVSWLHTVLFVFENEGTRTLQEIALERANNIGAWGMQSAILAAAYLSRYDVIDDIVDTFKQHVGDDTVVTALSYTDPQWQPTSDYISLLHPNTSLTTGGSTYDVAYINPEERAEGDTNPVSWKVTPWTIDSHEWGYLTGMTAAAVALEAQIEGTSSPTFDPWTFADADDEFGAPLCRAWMYMLYLVDGDGTPSTTRGRYSSGSGGVGCDSSVYGVSLCANPLEDNDRDGHPIVLAKCGWVGEGADEGPYIAESAPACDNPSADGSSLTNDVARGFGFAGFLFPEADLDDEPCNGYSSQGN